MKKNIDLVGWKEEMKKKGSGKVALYGAGKYGKIALKKVQKCLPELEVVCFLDDDRIRNGKEVEGISIYSLEEAMKKIDEFSILITNFYVTSVLKRIEAHHFDINKVFFVNELLIEDISKEYIKLHDNELKQAFDYLEDYQSKMIFRTMVEARYTNKIDLLSRTCQQNQYFAKDIIQFNENEVFVDAGAFKGDTIEQFIENAESKYKYIYAFEPDQKNYEELKKNNCYKNVLVYNAGLWNETTKINFMSNQGGSSKIGTGQDLVQVYRFDELEVPDKEVTFVKMDIEGSELNALKGMKNTIKNSQPKLAICIYHKFEDLWELPLYIKKIVPEYKLYIRNYTSYLDEVVLYATI